MRARSQARSSTYVHYRNHVEWLLVHLLSCLFRMLCRLLADCPQAIREPTGQTAALNARGIDASRRRGLAGQGCSTCEMVPTKRGILIQQLGRARARDRAGSTGRAGRPEEGKRLTCRFLMDRLRSWYSLKISGNEQLRTGESHQCLPLYHNVSICQRNVCTPDEPRASFTPGEVKPTHRRHGRLLILEHKWRTERPVAVICRLASQCRVQFLTCQKLSL
jgi:hypothetical protein